MASWTDGLKVVEIEAGGISRLLYGGGCYMCGKPAPKMYFYDNPGARQRQKLPNPVFCDPDCLAEWNRLRVVVGEAPSVVRFGRGSRR